MRYVLVLWTALGSPPTDACVLGSYDDEASCREAGTAVVAALDPTVRFDCLVEVK